MPDSTYNLNEYTGTMTQLVISILIIIANFPVLFISITKRNRIGIDSILISAVAINDFLIGICMLGYTVYKLVENIHIYRFTLYCQLSAMVHAAFSTGMCFSVTSLAIYRYFSYVKGVKISINYSVGILLTLTCIGYSFAVLCAVFNSYTVMPSNVYCFLYFNTNTFGLIPLWLGLSTSVVGYPIIGICYISISIHQYKLMKQLQVESAIYLSNNSELKRALKHQRIKGSFQVLFAMGLFALQTGPQLVCYLLTAIFKFNRSPMLDFVIDTVFRLTALTNPLLILLFHHDFCSILTKMLSQMLTSISTTINRS